MPNAHTKGSPAAPRDGRNRRAVSDPLTTPMKPARQVIKPNFQGTLSGGGERDTWRLYGLISNIWIGLTWFDSI